MTKEEFEMRCAQMREPTLRAWRFLLQDRVFLVSTGRGAGKQYLKAPTGFRYTPAYGITMRHTSYGRDAVPQESGSDDARPKNKETRHGAMNETWRQPLSLLLMIKDARQYEPDEVVVEHSVAALALVGSALTPAQFDVLVDQRYGQALKDHQGSGKPLMFRAASVNRMPHQSWLYLTVGHAARDVCNIQVTPEAMEAVIQAI